MPRLDHIGIAVPKLGPAITQWRAMGFAAGEIEIVAAEQVRVAMLEGAPGTRIELLEPMSETSSMARFLARRGPGLHHVAFAVPHLAACIAELRQAGLRLLPPAAAAGAGGHAYVFVHPASAAGVLTEFIEDPAAAVADIRPVEAVMGKK